MVHTLNSFTFHNLSVNKIHFYLPPLTQQVTRELNKAEQISLDFDQPSSLLMLTESNCVYN